MSKPVQVEETVDRISSLPDSILGHILSFLPTKVAVSTCILLTRSRWRDIFPFCNNLDFVQSGNRPYDTRHFIDFVDWFIMLMNGTSIDKFRLKCSNAVDTSIVHSWIVPLLRNVRELDLCIGWRPPGKEFPWVFTCNTLVFLKLGIGLSLNLPASVCFPCLKTLHLQSVRLADKDSPIQSLVSSCPVLEDLLVDGCYMEDLTVISLSSACLKRLTLQAPNGHRPYKLELDTPSLVYLKFAVWEREGHILKNLKYLHEVHVYIEYLGNHDLSEGLGNVQSLYLSGYVQNFLRPTMIVSEELPVLKNLTRLVINDKSFLEMSVAMKLLQCCPNLEEFVIGGSIRGGHQNVPCCLPSRLNYIECALIFYRGAPYRKENVESLEYFLKNANMLEKMQIHIWYSCEVSEKLGETMMETLKKLAKVPRRSKSCEINFCFHINIVVEDQVSFISEFSAFNSIKITFVPLFV